MIRIRDPIHGSIAVNGDELPIVDSRVFQRLRGIKQLGFTDQAFPGATHTRYAHGLGAMEVATRMFDTMFPIGGVLGENDRVRLRQIVRLAVLLHDVGHPPASHASEPCMPARRALGLDGFTEAELDERASHEDYTRAFIVQSDLRTPVDALLDRHGGNALDVAHLVTSRYPGRSATFLVGGVDYFPLLTQIVSGEMDADRMDYLQRDSFYAGVSYGRFDQAWLVENLSFHVENDAACLALSHRAVFAFEDFLLSRYHMFVSVYYHYIPIGFDSMLLRFFTESPLDFQLPGDVGRYVDMDDIALWSALRTSRNPWAYRIAHRQSFKRVLEINADLHPDLCPPDLPVLEAALLDAGVEFFTSRDKGVLSKYYGGPSARPMFIINEALPGAVPVERYSRIFERYRQPTPLIRIYCRPDQADLARRCLESHKPVIAAP